MKNNDILWNCQEKEVIEVSAGKYSINSDKYQFYFSFDYLWLISMIH